MTEAEMKTKWCAFTRLAVPAGMVNRVSRAMWRILKPGTADFDYYEDIEVDCNCRGSRCGHWRWAWLPTSPHQDLQESATNGYCGLAGKPGGQP